MTADFAGVFHGELLLLSFIWGPTLAPKFLGDFPGNFEIFQASFEHALRMHPGVVTLHNTKPPLQGVVPPGSRRFKSASKEWADLLCRRNGVSATAIGLTTYVM